MGRRRRRRKSRPSQAAKAAVVKKRGATQQKQQAVKQQQKAVDTQKGQGEQWSREQERDKVSTLLGMEQQAVAGAQERADAAKAAQWDAIGSMASSAGGLF